MTILDPSKTTLGDICDEALHEAGVVGLGQRATAEDSNAAWARVQIMLQEWQRKRFLIYHNVTLLITSSGALSYPVGPSAGALGGFETGAGSVRPNRIEYAFLRQLIIPGGNNAPPGPLNTAINVDYPLEQLQSMEDYNHIRLKQLMSFPGYYFYDPAWPLGSLFVWPVPNPAIYALGAQMREQLPQSFVARGRATLINLPYEYYSAILYNAALRLRSRYQIPTFPGDPLPGLAKAGEEVLRSGNNAIARLQMPRDLGKTGGYNIFGDLFS